MTLKAEFEAQDAKRANVTERVRECAAFTIPWVLPEENTKGTDTILQPYQSLGSSGIENLVGKLVGSLFPTGTPWWSTVPSAQARTSDLSPEDMEAFKATLLARDLLIESKLDDTNYRIAQRAVLENVMVAGNSLAFLTRDYMLKTFRFDQYVQRRAGGRLSWVIASEQVDVTSLPDETIAAAALDREKLMAGEPADRIQSLYTKAEWQRGGSWVITQEINEHQVKTSEEPVSPFFSVGYRELAGEDYSRGFVEARLGDLRSFNGLAGAILDLTIAAARLVPVYDPAKGWTTADLTSPNGQPRAGRVDGSTPNGIGFLQSNKHNDISVAMTYSQMIEKRLAKAMLLESSAQPTGERVTAAQIMRIARELEGALGGVYTHIAEEIQKPFLNRVIWQMERDKLLVPLPANAKAHELSILTGIEALRRQAELDRLLLAMQVLGPIPGAMQRIKFELLADRILRLLGINTPELIKTPEELEAELEKQRQAGLDTAASEQAIKSIGAIAENSAA